jgi:signal peptidase I
MLSDLSHTIGSFFLDIIETVVIALSIFLIVYLFIMQPHQVNGSSMFPTYEDGQYLLTDKISYKVGIPKRGDVIVFRAPEAAQCPEGTGCDFIKRIIGLPGETLEIRSDLVYINGQELKEDYLPVGTPSRPGNYTANGPIKIPENSYMVMGDNRNHSSDSRTWGPVDKSLIVGKVFFRYWPPNVVGLIHGVTDYNVAGQ